MHQVYSPLHVIFLWFVSLAFCRAHTTEHEILVPDDGSFPSNPILDFRPHFVRSLPVQILLIGIVTTLVVTLLIHLISTAQYHWPLAPVNYALQLSSVLTLLVSLVATLHVILSTALAESLQWPFMLSYISVSVPPFDDNGGENAWGLAERNMWLIMNASTSGLIQITHIQFLTLLFPSRLEGKLIFFLLGPLAVVATVMQLVPMRGDDEQSLIASAVRNVCNATLSLLFAIFLFIWGLLVNRGRAWRTDGGTAAFGTAALGLAVVSTGLTFLYVPREEEYVWLPGLMWSVVLWQSFFGWWWWIGAGNGSGAWLGERLSVAERLKGRRPQQKSDDGPRCKDERSQVAVGVNSDSATEFVASSSASASRCPPTIQDWFARVRVAHWAAVTAQAAEQEEIRRMRQGLRYAKGPPRASDLPASQGHDTKLGGQPRRIWTVQSCGGDL